MPRDREWDPAPAAEGGPWRGRIRIADLWVWYILEPGHPGPQWAVVHQVTGERLSAGLAYAGLRWSEGEGDAPDLVLRWRADSRGVEVSDLLLLATDPQAQRAVAAFCGATKLGGRPAGLTTIVDDAQVHDVVALLRRDRVRVTQRAVAARGGWTIDELRGYLRVNGRDWKRDFSHR